MVLDIVQVGHPALRQRATVLSRQEILSDPIQRLIENMRDTMRDAPGVGLAAPQVGQSLALAVVEDRPEYMRNVSSEHRAERQREPVPFHVIVNPGLTVVDPGPLEFFEGCLSFAGFVGLVPRAAVVRVDAMNERGEPVQIEARGWYARILQHEIDHLFGHVCIDRMSLRTMMTNDNFAQKWAGQSVADIRRALGAA